EATLRPRVRGERGVDGNGDGDGQSEAVVVVEVPPIAGAVESLEGLEEAMDLLRRDHRPRVRDGDDSLDALDPGGDLHPAAGHVVAHGVVQQVGDKPFDQCRVACRWGARDPGHQSGVQATGPGGFPVSPGTDCRTVGLGVAVPLAGAVWLYDTVAKKT